MRQAKNNLSSCVSLGVRDQKTTDITACGRAHPSGWGNRRLLADDGGGDVFCGRKF